LRFVLSFQVDRNDLSAAASPRWDKDPGSRKQLQFLVEASVEEDEHLKHLNDEVGIPMNVPTT
jgi:hypothetical protein